MANLATKVPWGLGCWAPSGAPSATSSAMPRGWATPASLSSWTAEQFDLQLDWGKIAKLKEMWGGKLILKGILDAEDAKMAMAVGADAIIVSNHGGRQLDGAISSIRMLPSIWTPWATGSRCIWTAASAQARTC
jgi:L-lactate dehydrogenase (cytochrome)